MITLLASFHLLFLAASASASVSTLVLLKTDQQVPHLNLYHIHPLCEDFEFIIDTGSSDLWISDASCEGCPKRSANCLQHIDDNTKLREIQYASGWVKGFET